MKTFRLLSTVLIAWSLAGCGYLGIESPAQQTASREAEGKAIGGACRHAGRALEDCFAYNPMASKAAIFNGWKTMNDYMVENKIEVVKPLVEPRLPKGRKPQPSGDASRTAEGGKDAEGKTADKGDRPAKLPGMELEKPKVSSR